MKGRLSRSRSEGPSIGEVLMAALPMTPVLQEVSIRTENRTSSEKEGRDSRQGEEAEDEEIEGEVVGDVVALLPTELLSKQRLTP